MSGKYSNKGSVHWFQGNILTKGVFIILGEYSNKGSVHDFGKYSNKGSVNDFREIF